jgi:hypothetical protein
MRKFLTIAGPLVATAAIVLVGAAATAAPAKHNSAAAPMANHAAMDHHHSMSADRVPDDALDPYRTFFKQFRSTAFAESKQYGAITDNKGISCIADPGGSGAMGIHYVNGAELTDGQIDAQEPEAFVYAPGKHGRHLVALEYIVFQDAWDASHTERPALFPGHPFMLTPAGNRFDLPAFYSQHVWIGRSNPLGNLAMWNPRVHCPS